MVSNYLKIHPLLFSIPIMLIIVAFALMLYYTYTRSLRLQKHLKTHFLSSLEEERKSISREMHDTISVFSISMKNNIQQHEDIKAYEKAAWLEQIIAFEKNIQDINELLYPIELKHGSLFSALDRLCLILQKSGKTVMIINKCSNINIPNQSIIHIYRILQESIVNIFKHTENSRISLSLFEENNELNAIISYHSEEKINTNRYDKNRRGQLILQERLDLINGSRSIAWEEDVVFEKFKFQCI